MDGGLKLSEFHHANVLIAFYDGLTRGLGCERGREVFFSAERAYGSRRGRRMALRALRDGNSLDYVSYFAYGELISTPGAYKGEFAAFDGLVAETQWACPWADAFAKCGGLECAKLYCTEIDAAVVRGFNPSLDYEFGCCMHGGGECRFFFRGKEIGPDTMKGCAKIIPQGSLTREDMTYHTGDVYQVFRNTVNAVCPSLIGAIKQDISMRLSPEVLALIEHLADNTDYETIR